MILLHTHRGELLGSRGLRRGRRSSAVRAIRKISTAFKALTARSLPPSCTACTMS
jgi:hypothetical protein